MSAKHEVTVPEPRVTIDDLKHRATDVKTKAISEAKGAVDAVMGEQGARTLVVVAGVVLVAVSIAYFLGTRSRRARGIEGLLGE